MCFLVDYGSPEALSHLRIGHRLAVMPSLRENFPCAVSECLECAIPFIASSRGGGKELVRAEDRDVMFVPPTAVALANRLRTVLRTGMPPVARLAHTREALSLRWLDLPQAQEGRAQRNGVRETI